MHTHLKRNFKKIFLSLLLIFSCQTFLPFVDVLVTQTNQVMQSIGCAITAVTAAIYAYSTKEQQSRLYQRLKEEHDKIAAQEKSKVTSAAQTSAAAHTPAYSHTMPTDQITHVSTLPKANDQAKKNISKEQALPETPATTNAKQKSEVKTLAQTQEEKFVKQFAQSAAPVLTLPKSERERRFTVIPAYEHPSSWQWREVPGGIEIRDEETGVWLSVTAQEPSPARQYGQAVDQQWQDETVLTLARMQVDPEYRKYIAKKLNYVIGSFLRTNHENWVDRLEARLDLLEQWDTLSFAEPYKTNYEKAVNDLIVQFYNTDGKLDTFTQDKQSPEIIRNFLNAIRLNPSNPAYQASELYPTSGSNAQHWTTLRSNPDQVFINNAIHNPANRQLREFIQCCRQFNFNGASAIRKQHRALEPKYQIPDIVFNEIERHFKIKYQKEYNEHYTQDGIPRSCTNDPLFTQIPKQNLKKIVKNNSHRKNLVQALLARQKIIELMKESWEIKETTPAIKTALYTMLGTENTPLTDPQTMLATAINLTSNYTEPDHNEVTQALFTKHGIFKDFVDYQHTKQLSLPTEILSQEHHETRTMLNQLLYLEHANPNTPQAAQAKNALDYIQAYYQTTNSHDKAAYKNLFTQIHHALAQSTDHPIFQLPNLAAQYTQRTNQEAHATILDFAQIINELALNKADYDPKLFPYLDNLKNAVAQAHESNKSGNAIQAQAILAQAVGYDASRYAEIKLFKYNTASILNQFKILAGIADQELIDLDEEDPMVLAYFVPFYKPQQATTEFIEPDKET